MVRKQKGYFFTKYTSLNMYMADVFYTIVVGLLLQPTWASVLNAKHQGISDITTIPIPLSTHEANYFNNYITLIPTAYFTDLPGLEIIVLRQNHITDIMD